MPPFHEQAERMVTSDACCISAFSKLLFHFSLFVSLVVAFVVSSSFLFSFLFSPLSDWEEFHVFF